MLSVARYPTTAATASLRLAVHHPAAAAVAGSLARQFGGGVRARVVHRAQDVRVTDDLVVVIGAAGAFVRAVAHSLGALAPPVLVVVSRAEADRVPAVRAGGQLVVDRVDGLTADLVSFAALAAARCSVAAPVAAPTEPLTPREGEIMSLLAAGYSTREIAGTLAIRGKTVRNYLSNIYRKLGARGQAEALVRWLSAAGSQA